MIINKPALSAALKMIGPVISNNPIIPAHSGVKITDKYLTAGNSGISVAIPVSLGIPDCVLDYSILSKAVFGLSGEIDLTADDKVAVLKSTEGKVNVPVICQPNEYPAMSQEFKHEDFTLTRDDIAVLSQTALFASTDYLRPAMTGVFYNGQFFCGTDGHTIAIFNRPSDFVGEVVFPRELFKVLNNIGAETYTFTKGYVIANNGKNNIAFVKYLAIEEKFPAVEQLLNSFSFTQSATAEQDELAAAFDLLNISVDGETKMVELDFEVGGGVTGISGKEEINTYSEKQIASENEGMTERFEIGFNLNLLSKGLKFLGGNSVKMEFKTPQTACRITSETPNRTLIIMPMMLKPIAV